MATVNLTYAASLETRRSQMARNVDERRRRSRETLPEKPRPMLSLPGVCDVGRLKQPTLLD